MTSRTFPRVEAREIGDGDRKTWVFPILRSGTDLCDHFVENLEIL
jgi:hypothetical protein